ncbi:MAG: ferrochelatase [Candidatus Parcubacteria bacterium]|nr:ferrochelatase [Burkholderiales bacterium]
MPDVNGILLVNLGTPTAPTPQAVRRYLAEFLSDPRVVELPRFVWLPILHCIVLRTRPAKSAKKYQAIWTPEGSPLAVHTRRQAQLLCEALAGRNTKVTYAMRYGEPPIRAGLAQLQDCSEVVVVPLYPQYSRSTTESIRDLIGPKPAMVRSFHDHPGYIGALADGVQRHWAAHGRGGKLVMSFHGLPKRSIELGDPYHAQCLATAKILAGVLRLAPADYAVTFQSRFGAAEWLQPYTEPSLVALARAGTARVDVLCPGFVSDCLETLEEIAIEAKRAFLAAGGREFHALPCLNESPAWIDALARISREAGTRNSP